MDDTLDECTGQSVDVANVDDDWDVEKRYGAVQEDEFVDESNREVSGDPPQQYEVH